MPAHYDAFRGPSHASHRKLEAGAGLLPAGVLEVGLMPEALGWYAYCERGSDGDFLDSAPGLALRTTRGARSAAAELADWMQRHWGFEADDAREAARRLFEQ